MNKTNEARSSGTPFLSFFAPNEKLSLAQKAGFKNTETISASDLNKRYFVQRTNNLSPASSEEILFATT
jgi:O-methyltransferase involved in polyketide biosynthesis